ncbi:hypothetical protein K440DRAFT_561049 [Wilcoxina mikolae CBS 423.85]|nr:hypothetical protein K440DRAFT_561049 [Wilcoxina mikolae CBS 423.85]
MEYISHDSELMNQHVAAVAVPNSSHFIAVSDEHGRAMIFSLGTDKKFYVLKQNEADQREVTDVGKLLRLDLDYTASAFAVSQDVTTADIYVVFAVDKEDSDGESQLIVLRGFRSKEYDLSKLSTDLRVLQIPQQSSDSTPRKISDIYMNNSVKNHVYPLTLIAFQPLDKINQQTDLARVNIADSLDGWTLALDLNLPENAFTMIALQPVNIPFGSNNSLSGFAALYVIQGVKELIFMSIDKVAGQYYRNSLTCPPGRLCAQALSTFTNKDGFTDLLVGGQGLYHFQASQLPRKDSMYNEISQSGVFQSIREIYVAQVSTTLSVWAADNDDGVGYLLADVELENVQSPVQVIPDSQGGNFTPFISPIGGKQEFIVSDIHGVLSLLEQDTVLGLWKTVPLFTPALEKTVEFRAYMTQITISDINKLPMVDSEVILKCSGSVSIIANGRSVAADPSGTPVRTDQSGLLTLIIPTEDIHSYTFSVQSPGGKGQVFMVDPTEKVNQELSKIQTGKDLENATLQDGSKLLGDGLSPQTIDRAAQAIAAMQSVNKKIKTKGSPEKGFASTYRVTKTHSYKATKTRDAWHWFESTATKIESWAINTIEEGAELVVQLAEKTYRWVLNGLTEIGKALSWLFDKILQIADKVIEWIGFVFDWKDIQVTHRSIVHLVNSALDTGAEYLGTLEPKVEDFFDDLATTIKAAADDGRPSEVDESTADSNSPDTSTTSPAQLAKVNWVQYQLTHGGASSASVIHDSPDGDSDDVFKVFWDDVVVPFFETLEETAKELGKTVFELFDSNHSLSVKDAMSKMGTEILLGFIDGVKKLAIGFLKLGKAVISNFQKFINCKVDIPIFSALYKEFISGGDDLTFLDGFSMILAIPVTIIIKMATGKAPVDLTGFDYGGLVKGDTTADDAQLLGFNQVCNVTGLIASLLAGVLDAVSLVTSFGNVSRISNESGRSLSLDQPHQSSIEMDSVLKRFRAVSSIKEIGKDHWKDVLAVVACIIGIPTKSGLPANVLRWVSWTLVCVNRAVAAAIRQVEKASALLVEKALAVLQAVLGTINYIIVVTIKATEFETSEFPGKNNAQTLLDIVAGTFSLVDTASSSVAHIAEGKFSHCEGRGRE